MPTASEYTPLGSGTTAEPARALSLDDRTLLPRPSSGHGSWLLTVHEGTGEVSCCKIRSYVDPLTGEVLSPGHQIDRRDPQTSDCLERAKDNGQRVARRRKSEVRRYCVRNKLTRLWTLTYAQAVTDRGQVIADMQEFTERLYDAFGRMPWLRVLELHKGGWCDYCQLDHVEGRYHVHLGLPAVWLSHTVMEGLWGHGFVNYRDRPQRAGRVTLSGRDLARQLAGYMAKYLVKDCEAGPREHGYEVAQGYAVGRTRVRYVPTFSGCKRVLASLGLSDVTFEASSTDWVGWRGPPVRVLWFREGG